MPDYTCDCPYEGEGYHWEKAHTEKCIRDHLTYKEIAARAKESTRHLAPLYAQPKLTKGDTHRQRFRKLHPANEHVAEVYGLNKSKSRVKIKKPPRPTRGG